MGMKAGFLNLAALAVELHCSINQKLSNSANRAVSYSINNTEYTYHINII